MVGMGERGSGGGGGGGCLHDSFGEEAALQAGARESLLLRQPRRRRAAARCRQRDVRGACRLQRRDRLDAQVPHRTACRAPTPARRSELCRNWPLPKASPYRAIGIAVPDLLEVRSSTDEATGTHFLGTK